MWLKLNDSFMMCILKDFKNACCFSFSSSRSGRQHFCCFTVMWGVRITDLQSLAQTWWDGIHRELPDSDFHVCCFPLYELHGSEAQGEVWVLLPLSSELDSSHHTTNLCMAENNEKSGLWFDEKYPQKRWGWFYIYIHGRPWYWLLWKSQMQTGVEK